MNTNYLFSLCKLLCISFLCFIFISCNDNKEIREFAKYFAYAVNAEDFDKISTMMDSVCQFNWKEVELRDIDPDSVNIKQQSVDTYIVECVDSAIFVISKVSNRYVIKSTFNIITVDNNQKRLAQLNGLVKDNMDDYTIYQTVHSDKFVRLVEERKARAKENAIFISNQKKIPSLLEDFENCVSFIDEVVRNHKDETIPALYTTLGMKALMYAENSRSQVAKYEEFMTDEQHSRYVKASKQFQYYVNNQDSI